MTQATTVSSAQTTDVEGNTTSSESGTPTSLAISDAVTDFGDVTTKIASGLIDAQPIISIPQGTRVKVFVNKDLVFPESNLVLSH